MNSLFLSIVLISLLHLGLSDSFPITRHQAQHFTKAAESCGSTGDNDDYALGFGNCFDNIYYINIDIGTPSQTLGLQFDTGSNTLWVPTQYVSGVSPVFNTSKSNTFTNTSRTGGVQYVDGSGVSGTYGTDILKIQNSPISITTQYLWVTKQVDMKYPQGIQGLVGMGFTKIKNFLDIAYQQGQIQSPVFALEIKDTKQQSLIHYNQIPEQIVNSTEYQPVSSSYYWGVRVTGVQVGGNSMSNFPNLAVIDSGTSYFYISSTLFNQIVDQYFSGCSSFQGIPICSCSNTNKWPSFTFSFTEIQVFIQPSDYIAEVGPNLCTYLFGSISGFNQILLGDIFFRNYIITFDKQNQRIGFSGQTRPSPRYFSQTMTNLGWGLLGLCALIAVSGIVTCIFLDKVIEEIAHRQGVFFPQYQLSSDLTRQRLNE